MRSMFKLLGLLTCFVVLLAASAAAEAGNPHGAAVRPQSHGAGATHGKAITLVEQGRLAELEQDRHRSVVEETITIASDESGIDTLWLILIGVAAFGGLGALASRTDYVRDMRLGAKLFGGFGAVVVLAMVLGLGGYYYLGVVSDKAHLEAATLEMDMMVGEVLVAQNEFILYGLADPERGEKIVKETRNLLAEYQDDIEAILAFHLNSGEKAALDQLKGAVADYAKTFDEVIGDMHELQREKAELGLLGKEIVENIEMVLHKHERELEQLGQASHIDIAHVAQQTHLVEACAKLETLTLKLGMNRISFMLDKKVGRIAVSERYLGELFALIDDVRRMITELPASEAKKGADIQALTIVEEDYRKYVIDLGRMMEGLLGIEGNLVDLTQSMRTVEAIATALSHQMEQVSDAAKADANLASVVLMLLVATVGSLLAFFVTRSITRPVAGAVHMLEEMARGHLDKRLNMARKDEIGQMAQTMDAFADSLQHEVVDALQKLANGDLTFSVVPKDSHDVVRGALKKLGEDLNGIMGQIQVAGEQIASGSVQVSDASQSLSQGATESASSLEQVAASMNEMASQTRLNAENAAQANGLSLEAKQAAETGNGQMQAMVAAMDEINEAGQNISKIIKVIDEIAFQTNLLALNAAVEAARAGQHGKGFAVVAEEVRNLAARSAKAAKETADLIEGSVQKTGNGSRIASQTAEALGEIVGSITKVTSLVEEIAAASNEQAEGIAQVNQGLTQIDQVTQQNTANAEEGAAASEELSSQAQHMKEMLARFKLADGQKGVQEHVPAPPAKPTRPQLAAPLRPETKLKPEPPEWGGGPAPCATAKVDPTSLIALDDEEFGKY